MIVLCRHAESEFNAGHISFNSQLTVKGIYDAQKLSENLSKQYDLSKFKCFVSPLKRCIETACAITRLNPANFVIRKELGELSSREYSTSTVYITNWIQMAYNVAGANFAYNDSKLLDSWLSAFVKEIWGDCFILTHRPVIKSIYKLITGKDYTEDVANCQIIPIS